MTVPETNGSKFVWPADYYSGPTPVAVLPRGVAYGCGGAAALVLIVLLVGGALVTGSQIAQLMDLSLTPTMSELRGMYAADVTPAQKQSFEAEIERMRGGLREEKVSIVTLQPVLQQLTEVMSDSKVTSAELTQLENAVRRVNTRAKL